MAGNAYELLLKANKLTPQTVPVAEDDAADEVEELVPVARLVPVETDEEDEEAVAPLDSVLLLRAAEDTGDEEATELVPVATFATVKTVEDEEAVAPLDTVLLLRAASAADTSEMMLDATAEFVIVLTGTYVELTRDTVEMTDAATAADEAGTLELETKLRAGDEEVFDDVVEVAPLLVAVLHWG